MFNFNFNNDDAYTNYITKLKEDIIITIKK